MSSEEAAQQARPRRAPEPPGEAPPAPPPQPPRTPPPAEPDYYDILGVARDANAAELKRAYRERARELHPDVSTAPDGEDRFRQLAAVYDILSDPKRRARYDRAGPRRRPASTAGPPLDLELEWYEGKRGASKLVTYEEPVPCAGCAGSGVQGAAAPVPCARCRGTGVVRRASYDGSTALIQVEDCPACDGRGHERAHRCTSCGGSGRDAVVRTARVRVPVGVRDGDLIEFDDVPRRFRVRLGERPRDSRLVLATATLALACALALLLYMLLMR